VNPNRACVGDMITFTLSGVVDNGGQKRKNCVVVSDGPITPTYTWTMFLPANYPSPWPPLTGTGKIVNVEAKVPGSYRVTYIARANRTCPPPPRTIDSTTARAVSVRVANIDATDPHAAKINYFTHPGGALVDSVTFSAPGASGSLTNVVGDFFFTFDQSDLPTGASILQLDYTVGGSTCSPVHTTATRTWAKAPPQGNAVEVALFKISLEEGIFTIPVQHEIFGQFHFICYSANVVLGSKTLWVGLALVNIRTEESTEFPTEIAAWNESHLYSDTAGDHLEQIMPLVTGPTFPPQGPYFRSARLSFNTFFAPGNGLTSIARIDSLLFDTSNGPVLAIPIPLIGNTEIDLPLEANAAPVVDCP
jgi:hypothetical protein